MNTEDAKNEVLTALRAGLCTARALAGKVRRSERTVYRIINALRQDGHRIVGEAGIGFMLRGQG